MECVSVCASEGIWEGIWMCIHFSVCVCVCLYVNALCGVCACLSMYKACVFVCVRACTCIGSARGKTSQRGQHWVWLLKNEEQFDGWRE